ncbi:2-dehydro-3-deoxygalactonokinase [Scleromatobacter humisilvae]|uniref:2-dehydro-3-deoxygalactonokinase n=1 Tax=Scleromatobacter humisilvae TaxID=2897159 RepID=A0A9X2C1L9_9BURK|nr:2-dehydro-3-deoxygalactonokinase [Scleromatobacter humisilvae]MCK9685909.1 2-dehydro-3-deoxygalactonokinase [Scleromatobacter humisilvae]
MTAAFIGIDWGTTHRRAALIAGDGTLIAERADGEGALACKGRFGASLEALVASLPQASASLPVVMAGMVGAAIGWQAVPYLDAATPLSALARHLAPVAEAPPGKRWSIAPGYCVRGAAGEVDVMRGEETQLFGALHLLGADAADGSYVLPGTHSKWVRLHAGRITELRTYMTGELFALLRQHGTLASAMQTASADDAAGLRHDSVADDPEFLRGVAEAAAHPVLTHALFGARARVVTGGLAPGAAAAYVSGLLIGAEWADAQRQVSPDEPVRVIGEPALAALHAACAHHHGRRLESLDARQIQLAAWRALATQELTA